MLNRERLSKFSELFLFVVYLAFLAYVFRDLFHTVNSSLTAWYDYPYIIWVMNNVIGNLKNFSFNSFFETNAFYPFPKTLLFSDLLIPQTVLYSLIKGVLQGSILSFNISILFIAILNYISLRYFFGYFFKKSSLSFIATILFFFSPYFTFEFGHYQMFTYFWYFFSVGLILRKISDKHWFIWSLVISILVVLQFLSSVYLAIYLLSSVLILFFVCLIFSNRSKNILFFLSVVVFSASLLFPWAKQYEGMKNYYGIKKDLSEFIQYSAHLTDYLFFYNSSPAQLNTIFTKWNGLNKHGLSSSNPGIIVSLCVILFFSIGIIKLLANKRFVLEINYPVFSLFISAIIGLIFSFGPRLNVNGVYAHIPLPYGVLLKIFKFLESSRAPSRWSFLFYVGMAGLATFIIKRLFEFAEKRHVFLKYVFFILLIVAIFADLVPVNIQATAEEYVYPDTDLLSRVCKKEDVVLFVPYSHLVDTEGGTIVGLNYISRLLLSTDNFSCKMVNGYSGYLPDELLNFFRRLTGLVNDAKCVEYVRAIKDWGVKYLVFRRNSVAFDFAKNYDNCFVSLTNKGLLNNLGSGVYLVK